MERWAGRVALVTGASTGLGEAIARRLVHHGMKVVGCARQVEKIQQMVDELKDEKGSLTAVQCDVSKEDQVLTLFEDIKAMFGVIHVCVNNAGLVRDATLLAGNTEDWRLMFDVNVIGLCICTREAVKLMKANGVDDGHIFNMNSTLGHWVNKPPAIYIYAATKHAIMAITEGLRNELIAEKSHIRVTNISPGLTRTNILYAEYADDPDRATARYGKYETLQPDDVADGVVYALSAPGRAQCNHTVLIIQSTAVTSEDTHNSIQKLCVVLCSVRVADHVTTTTTKVCPFKVHDLLIRPTEEP